MNYLIEYHDDDPYAYLKPSTDDCEGFEFTAEEIADYERVSGEWHGWQMRLSNAVKARIEAVDADEFELFGNEHGGE